jgi:hypothetical protein
MLKISRNLKQSQYPVHFFIKIAKSYLSFFGFIKI